MMRGPHLSLSLSVARVARTFSAPQDSRMLSVPSNLITHVSNIAHSCQHKLDKSRVQPQCNLETIILTNFMTIHRNPSL